MRAEDIRAFVERPREGVERLKREHWAARARAAEPESVLLGHLLFEHAREVDPTFPSERYLREDWEHHVRVKRLVDRARGAFGRR